MENLPNELLLEIFKRLDSISQFRVRNVSSKWDSLLRSVSIMKTVCIEYSQLLRLQNNFSEIDVLYQMIDSRFDEHEERGIPMSHLIFRNDLKGQCPNDKEDDWIIHGLIAVHLRFYPLWTPKKVTLDSVLVDFRDTISHINLRYCWETEIEFKDVEMRNVFCPASDFDDGIAVTLPSVCGKIRTFKDADSEQLEEITYYDESDSLQTHSATGAEIAFWRMVEENAERLEDSELAVLSGLWQNVPVERIPAMYAIYSWYSKRPVGMTRAEHWHSMDLFALNNLAQQLLSAAWNKTAYEMRNDPNG